MKRQEKIYYDNNNQKEVRVSIVTSDKADIRAKNITRDKECHFMMILMSVHVPSKTISRQMEQNLIDLKGRNRKINNYGRDFHTPLSVIDKT